MPDSLTQHLSNPKIVALRPRTRRRSAYHVPGLEKVAVTIVTLIVVVLAGGHLLRAW
ncbi:hypothetical protein [Methylobacterium sp. OAE515]|uniref:hypothetical protein n=1 Tax=Methylobacterium sp. OAE515 TaxID=2817895 RepID=UPI00178B490B